MSSLKGNLSESASTSDEFLIIVLDDTAPLAYGGGIFKTNVWRQCFMKYFTLIIATLFIGLADRADLGKEDFAMLTGVIFLNSSLIIFALEKKK